MLSDAQQLKHNSMKWFDSKVWIQAEWLDGMKHCLGLWFKVWKKINNCSCLDAKISDHILHITDMFVAILQKLSCANINLMTFLH